MKRFDELGTEVREIEDGLPDDLSADRAAFLERAAKPRPVARSWAKPALLSGAIGALAAAAIAAIAVWPDADLTFEVDGHPGEIGTWVAAPQDQERHIEFSDETTFVLAPTTHARVLEAGENDARIVIERGSTSVEVTHAADRTWSVLVGPFEVRVVGTKFDVAWDADRETFSIRLFEGAVEVSGPLLDGSRAVRAGEALTVSLQESRAELVLEEPEEAREREPAVAARASGEIAPVEEPIETPVEPRAEEPVAPEAARTSHASPPRESEPERPSWQALAGEGRYRDAVAAADVEAILRDAEPRELLRFGDVARLGARPDIAERAYREVRTRAPASPRGANAAFALGRLAFDSTHDYAAAAEWFRTYLREAPAGALAREALGRQMEAEARAGLAANAAQTASRYLERHPDGPHAGLARTLVTP
jgi:ferric-dicitrate binding protein FerR (iron transport regulator)